MSQGDSCIPAGRCLSDETQGSTGQAYLPHHLTMSKKATIHDIAKALGLNASTVSRALNNHPKVRAATRELVLTKAAELQYQPNHLAASLRQGNTHALGVLLPRINRNFFANVVNGIEQVATPAGYTLLITQSGENLAREIEALSSLIHKRVDGIILSISAETRTYDHLEALQQVRIPLVQFDRVIDQLGSAMVINDDVEAGRQMMEHLVAQGYRRIAHLGGPPYLNVYRNRYQGYLDGLQAHGLPLREDWVAFDALTQERGRACVAAWFDGQAEPPDAIMAASDFSALGALLALRERGIAIPAEVGVSGYANEPFTALMSPTLTSVEQRSDLIGQTAAQLLIQAIEGSGSADPQPVHIKPDLQLRESTARRG